MPITNRNFCCVFDAFTRDCSFDMSCYFFCQQQLFECISRITNNGNMDAANANADHLEFVLFNSLACDDDEITEITRQIV